MSDELDKIRILADLAAAEQIKLIRRTAELGVLALKTVGISLSKEFDRLLRMEMDRIEEELEK